MRHPRPVLVSGRLQTGLDTVCRKGSRLTESCLEDADCQTLASNTVCTRGECSCASGLWNHNNTEVLASFSGEKRMAAALATRTVTFISGVSQESAPVWAER